MSTSIRKQVYYIVGEEKRKACKVQICGSVGEGRKSGRHWSTGQSPNPIATWLLLLSGFFSPSYTLDTMTCHPRYHDLLPLDTVTCHPGQGDLVIPRHLDLGP